MQGFTTRAVSGYLIKRSGANEEERLQAAGLDSTPLGPSLQG